ncbi:hypothetical protein O181_007338 [Austropuccinia psidii MF-1]|uniref:Uncharacterized protein n=1 Tax=Austropuccinia psidii MF-1 TaxID=1389203 RepID=A0A9Q3BM80_9BASI|nr:hypothetical protein [Austropuccinia psidii MF-1]
MKRVHSRNGRSYSVKQDGSGKGRGKTRARPGKPSSRKAHLDDSRVSPHSPRFVPTNFDINYEPELIQGNVFRFEAISNGSHRNISVPVQKLVQCSQEMGVGNIPKPLEGAYELLLTHKEVSGSGEDHRALRKMESIVLRRKGQEDE